MKDVIIKEIILWMNQNDYIELQAVRGQIKRTDEKYVNYINEYNMKLELLKLLENENIIVPSGTEGE